MLQRKLRLVAYLRTSDFPESSLDQLNAIRNYCKAHDYMCVAVFEDEGKPSMGLEQAMDALKRADGIIAYDSRRFVGNLADGNREFRIIVEQVFKEKHKKLITVADGYENVTPAGQESMLEMINEWYRREEMPVPTYNVSEHARFSGRESCY